MALHSNKLERLYLASPFYQVWYICVRPPFQLSTNQVVPMHQNIRLDATYSDRLG
jgi:hypothetical protein